MNYKPESKISMKSWFYTDNMPVNLNWIDTHVHILPEKRLRGLIRWVKSFSDDFPLPDDYTIADCISEIRKSGVKCFCNLVFPIRPTETAPLNDFNARLCSEIDCAVPFGSFHIKNDDFIRETQRCIEKMGFAGMKLHPHVQGFSAFDKAFYPVYDILQGAGRPLIVHTGFDAFYEKGTDKESIVKVVEKFDRLKVVFVHAFYPDHSTARFFLSEFGNTYLDMTNSISCMSFLDEIISGISLSPKGIDMNAIENARFSRDSFVSLLEEESSRIMFGTDFPAGFGNHGRLLQQLCSLGLSAQSFSNILYETPLRLFEGIDAFESALTS